ncbi:MAG: hypothetical protein CMM93_06760 [Rickettsiales bacterium]|nr:hypothetical protein [Rickettsiales bacterium]
MAQQISDSQISYQTSSNNVQVSYNSEGCKNVIITNSGNQYKASTSVLLNQDVQQTATNQITSNLQSVMEQEIEGLNLGKKQTELVEQFIDNEVSTLLNSTQMQINSETVVNQTNNTQVCFGSEAGGNFIFTNQNDTYDYFNQAYANNSAVQESSTSIANYLSSQQSQKSTGLIASLLKGLAIIIIALAILALVVVFVIVAGGYAVGKLEGG